MPKPLDAKQVITKSHKSLIKKLRQYDVLSDRSISYKKALIEAIAREFLLHVALTDEHFFPVILQALPASGPSAIIRKPIRLSGILDVVEKLSPGDRNLDLSFHMLSCVIRARMREEMSFCNLKRAVPGSVLLEIGARMQAARAAWAEENGEPEDEEMQESEAA